MPDNLEDMIKIAKAARDYMKQFEGKKDEQTKEVETAIGVMEKSRELASADPGEYKKKGAACAAAAAKHVLAVLKNRGGREWKGFCDKLEASINVYDNYMTVHDYGMAVLGLDAAAACAAGWQGANVAHVGVKMVRALDPNHNPPQEAVARTDNAFKDIGGGAAGGATLGAAIGVCGGPPGAAIGAALGGAVGSIIGAIKFATQN